MSKRPAKPVYVPGKYPCVQASILPVEQHARIMRAYRAKHQDSERYKKENHGKSFYHKMTFLFIML